MPRPAELGRAALLDAGARLLADPDGVALSALSVNAVVAEAGMSKGGFFQHFPTRRDFLVALHRRFHDQILEVVGEAIAGIPPGAARIRAGVEAYLDACLRARGTKSLLVQARTEVNLSDEIATRNGQFSALATPDLAAWGWDDPQSVAVLLIATVAEVALHEMESGRPDPRLRGAVLTMATPPVRTERSSTRT